MSWFPSIRQWRPRHLLAAWSAYWAGLVLVTLGPATLAILRVTVPSGGKGSASAGFGDGMFNLVVTNGGATVWSGSAHAVTIACALAIPPLAMWVGWLMSRPSRTLHPARQGSLPLEGAGVIPQERAERASVGSDPPVNVNRSDATKDTDPNATRRRE